MILADNSIHFNQLPILDQRLSIATSAAHTLKYLKLRNSKEREWCSFEFGVNGGGRIAGKPSHGVSPIFTADRAEVLHNLTAVRISGGFGDAPRVYHRLCASTHRLRSAYDVDALDDELDDRHLDARQTEIEASVDRVVDGADVRATLEALLATFSDSDRDAVIGRFRRHIQRLNEEYARRRQEQARRERSGRIIDGVLFNPASAVLLMATGTYEKIAAVLRAEPELERETRAIGMSLLDAGVKPDMQMVQRLQEIYARAIQKQREAEQQE